MSTKNPLTAWMTEFLRHQPSATAAQAWSHLLTVAPAFGQLPWVTTVDTNGKAIAYRRRPGAPELVISRSSFSRQFRRCRAGQPK